MTASQPDPDLRDRLTRQVANLREAAAKCRDVATHTRGDRAAYLNGEGSGLDLAADDLEALLNSSGTSGPTNTKETK